MRIQDLTEQTTLSDTDVLVINNGSTKKITVANLKSELGVNSNVLRLNLSQSGTDAPTFTELENTTGANITASRLTTGTYQIEVDSDLFTTANNVYVMINGYRYPYAISAYRISSTIIQVQTWVVSTDGATDGALNRTSLEVRIYN
jgi:hypothetical protein